LGQHAGGGVVRVGEQLAGFADSNRGFLGAEDDVVQRALGGGEFAVGGESAGDVAGVAVQLTARVNQAQLARF
jgi:hypothetical protein